MNLVFLATSQPQQTVCPLSSATNYKRTARETKLMAVRYSIVAFLRKNENRRQFNMRWISLTRSDCHADTPIFSLGRERPSRSALPLGLVDP